jgi:aminoglycoside 6'-N-acetyltransferase
MSTCAFDPLPRVGSRIVLRRLRSADLDAFQAYRADWNVGRYQGWSPMSPGEGAAFLEHMRISAAFTLGEWLQLGIAERSTDHLIGDIGICLHGPAEAHAEIGFTLAPGAQGRGLGSEAVREALAMLFERTDIARVVAVTDARNVASVRLLQRVGMEPVETVHAVFRGEPCIELVHELRRDAWLSLQGAHVSVERPGA